jgi:hypothetical protein
VNLNKFHQFYCTLCVWRMYYISFDWFEIFFFLTFIKIIKLIYYNRWTCQFHYPRSSIWMLRLHFRQIFDTLCHDLFWTYTCIIRFGVDAGDRSKARAVERYLPRFFLKFTSWILLIANVGLRKKKKWRRVVSTWAQLFPVWH